MRAKDLREMVVVGDECDAEAPAVIDPLTTIQSSPKYSVQWMSAFFEGITGASIGRCRVGAGSERKWG